MSWPEIGDRVTCQGQAGRVRNVALGREYATVELADGRRVNVAVDILDPHAEIPDRDTLREHGGQP